MSKITVIVPSYNCEAYLGACLNSIIAQEYQNLEIIIINDGSTDGTARIAEEYKGRDSRIRVLHKAKNEGIGAGRNSGIAMATGDYIAFIDSDDMMDPNHLSDLSDLLQRTDSDIAVCNFSQYIEDENKYKIHIREEDYYEAIYTPKEWFQFQYGQPSFLSSCFTVPWGKLYKKELFEHILYYTDGFGEDDRTTWKLYLMADRIAYMHRPSLTYRLNSASMTQTTNQAEIFSQEPVFERLAVLGLIGFDLSREIAAYDWRSGINREHTLSQGDMAAYKNLKFHEALLKKYRKP
ncbi:glycosyltransferase family 2 protein [Streptococcus uberis]|uniref:glycosyltransferase family 2 protein n=1 Tax=Streptococcus uberis TaxID=1349 RepID=UPI0012B60255|nr:glycosyltransferase family 2 protein [Streptococcus uberis]MTB56995.1 glycosyltransferase [Streptococcus uberis]